MESIFEMKGVLRKHLVCHSSMGRWVCCGKGVLLAAPWESLLLQCFHLGKLLCPSAAAGTQGEVYRIRVPVIWLRVTAV